MIDFVEACHEMRQNRCILGACSGTHREQNTAPIAKIFIPDHLHTWRLTQKKSDQKILNRNIFSGSVSCLECGSGIEPNFSILIKQQA